MSGWKFGVFASVAWAAVSIALGVGLVWYVSAHPINPRVDEAREARAGEAAGMLLGVGLGAIWAYVAVRAWGESRGRSARPAAGYAPCPNCSSPRAEKVGFAWWGGVVGPALLTHVKCSDCGTAYNGRTGRPNTAGIVVYTVVVGAVMVALTALALYLWLAGRGR